MSLEVPREKVEQRQTNFTMPRKKKSNFRYSGRKFLIKIYFAEKTVMGRDSSVGIVIRYRLGSPGIESMRWRDFPYQSISALGSTLPHVQWVPGLFTRSKVTGAWR